MAYRKYNNYKKPAPVVKAARVVRPWSKYQLDLFDAVSQDDCNIHVDALAGSGKTTSSVECLYRINPDHSILYCAFAKDIVTELESRVPAGKDVRTFHSLGYRASLKAFPHIGKPDKDKLYGYIKAEMGDDPETYEERDNLKKAISLSKGYLAHSPEAIDPILDRHDIDVGDSRDRFIERVIKIMNATKKDTNRIDFDDMVWFPLVHGLKVPTYDNVIIDEAQDLNPAQIELGLQSVKPGGHITSVGDEYQSIYGFRGADQNAIQNIVTRLNSKRMPLSVTYRCAKSIVELAQTMVPELQAADDAEQGSVSELHTFELEDKVGVGDFILSRTNAPLVRICLNLLKAHVPANIQGKDIGDGFIALIKRSKATDVSSFLSWLTEWKEAEIDRLVKLKRDTSVTQDKVECLETLCQGTRSISDVKNNIEELFHNGKDTDRVMLSTTHKAKGLERDRVFLLRDTYKPGKSQEETNLYYVAVTRARKELYLVSKDG